MASRWHRRWLAGRSLRSWAPRRSCAHRQSEHGFTLIEVLVALSILGVSLAVLLSIFMQGLDRAHETRSESQARVLAQSLLTQARAATNPALGSSAGKTNGYLWRLQVVPYGTAADRGAWQQNPAEIIATVSWRGDGGMRSVTLSTLRLLPKPEAAS